MVVNLAGYGQAPAQLTLAPSMQDFGAVAQTNASTTANFSVGNSGEVATGMPSFSTGASTEFAVLSNTCGASIGPGGMCTVTVRFDPVSLGTRNGTLTASATPGGSVMASLTGQGVLPGTLAIAPGSRDFGSILIGQSGGTQVFTVSNTGGAATSALTVSIGGASSSYTLANDTCTGNSLPVSGSCTVQVNFTPQAAGPLSAFVQATATTGGTVQATLSGAGLRPAALSVSPTSFTWPTEVAGSAGTSASFVFTNDGDVSTGTLSTVLTGAAYSVKTTTCTGILAPQAPCTIDVTFAPATAGSHPGSLTVSATPGGSAVAALSGQAISPASLTLAPVAGSSADFGNVLIGATNTQTFRVTNTGQATSGQLSLSLTGADAADFQLSSGTGDCQPGQTLTGGMACTIGVRFTASTPRGAKQALFTVSATPGGASALTLQATAQEPAKLSSPLDTHAFGNNEVNVTSPSVSWTVTNEGDVSTGTLATSNPDPANFTIVMDTCNGASLAAMGSCSVRVAFNASSPGNKSTLLRVAGTPGGSAYLDVTGRGQWRLTVSKAGNGTGTLSTSDARITCGTTCSALYDNATVVTVQARTANGTNSHFQNWVSPANCTAIGNGWNCQVTMTASLEAKATFGSNANYNLAFTSSSTEPANRGGVGPYDARCNALATAAGINNAVGDDFMAWKSDSSSNAVARLPNNGGWRRLDGSVFAVSRSALTSSSGGVVVTQLDLDETGTRIPGATASTWTGTSKTGTYRSGHDCSNWTSLASSPSLDRGRTAGGPGLWTEGTGGHTCNNTGTRIYCLQKSRTNVLSLFAPPSGARFIFLAPPTVPLGSLTAMDNYCNSNKPTSPSAAASATYVAFLATTTVTAASRMAAGTYYRTDGTLVGTDAQLRAGILEAGLWQRSNGGYVNPTGASDPNILAWTGATSATVVATTLNCSNWSSSLATVNSLVGRATSAATDYFNGNGSSNACNVARPVYCIQQ